MFKYQLKTLDGKWHVHDGVKILGSFDSSESGMAYFESCNRGELSEPTDEEYKKLSDVTF
jgi:hypothetical protein